MRVGELLRQLDRRLLPPLAHGMARLGHGPVRPRVLTGTALLSSVAVLVTAVWAADRQPTGDPTVGEVTRVGVASGDSIPRYLASSRGELAAMLAATPSGPPTDTYALVTLTAYLAPDRLTPVLAGVAVSAVFSRVPLSQRQTEIVRIPAMRVPDDVVAGMVRVAERKDREALDYQRRSAGVSGDGDQETQLRLLYDSGAEVAAAEATAYRMACSCVYAAVVRGTPVDLEKIAERPEVRAVDPAPEVSRLDRAVFWPPLPEQDDVARPPADAGLPSDGAGATSQPTGSPPSSGSSPVATATPSPAGSPDPSPSPDSLGPDEVSSPSFSTPPAEPGTPTAPTPQ